MKVMETIDSWKLTVKGVINIYQDTGSAGGLGIRRGVNNFFEGRTGFFQGYLPLGVRGVMTFLDRTYDGDMSCFDQICDEL